MDFNFKKLDLKRFDPKIILAVSMGALMVLIIIGFAAYQMFKTPKVQNPQDEVKRLVSEVGKLLDLPTGEDPTVATITDISKLSGQPFFARAKNGDKVLIYTNAKKAILYDPNAKKVIDVAPINLGTPSGQVATPSATPR